jgi:hypothetical protein
MPPPPIQLTFESHKYDVFHRLTNMALPYMKLKYNITDFLRNSSRNTFLHDVKYRSHKIILFLAELFLGVTNISQKRRKHLTVNYF